ncbi:MAG: glycosyltransferase, partial [Planctomycetes bacterium]|nr:glycosyltransferase [Planctomycetota bacterium]
ADAIVSVADAMTRQALAAGVGRPEQFTTIYSGMETGAFLQPSTLAGAFRKGLNVEPGTILVTQVSRLAELKGHEYLIAAAGSLPASIHFCLVGDGYLRSRLEKQIAEAGLTDRFHLTGLLKPADMPAVMHASDIVVHCSLREGLPRALPQAMLAGKPVVAYDVDGAAEVVRNGQTGMLLPPADVPALISALSLLAGDADLRARLGEAGRELVTDAFAAQTMVERIELLYSRLARRT